MTHPDFDFVGRRRTWAILSGAILVVAALSLIIRPLQLSIDFEGGTSFLLSDIGADVEVADLRSAAEDVGASDVKAQIRTAQDGTVGAIVQIATLEGTQDASEAQELSVRSALGEVAGTDQIDVKFVGPTWGQRISSKAIEALIVFLIVVIVYITLRLEAKMAGAAVAALAHDVVITVGAYSLAGFTVSPSTVIALLTIMGYSLYDTVVVFDRIKETNGLLGEDDRRRTVSMHVNSSLNEVMWRSINTSMTSLLPVGSLLFVGSRLLGASTLSDLALALFVGMAAGTYSSLFVAGPFYSWWKEKEPQSRKLAEKHAARTKFQAAAAARAAAGNATTSQATTGKATTGKAAAGTASASATTPAPASDAPPAAQSEPSPEVTWTTTPPTTDYVRGHGKRKRGKR